MKFTCEMLTSRVVFGAGSLDQLPDELDRLGLSRVVILSTPEQQDQAQQRAKRTVSTCRVMHRAMAFSDSLVHYQTSDALYAAVHSSGPGSGTVFSCTASDADRMANSN